jgi:signal transduction histidine kinase
VQQILILTGAIILVLLINKITTNSEKEQLKKKQKIYAEKFIELYDDLKKAKKDIKARDEFLSVVSHELRTPLTTMLVTLHNMLNTIKNVSLANFSVSELIKVLKNSEIQIKRLKIIINDLLDVSLITTGRMQISPKKTDLVKTTRKVLESFSDVVKNKKNQITIEAPAPVFGNFDKTRIEQAIANLISNAVKYGDEKPIKIKIFSNKNTAHFIITDQGVGIPPKEQQLIFELFKRANWSKENSNGLGVGLYIVYQIVKAHGGEIKVSSKPGKGSTFSMELPLS